jgi:hypothetical protein
MLTNYLVRRITLNAVSARIPCQDSAFWTKQENGIVLNALDEQTESLVALAQVFLYLRVLEFFQRKQSFHGVTAGKMGV